MEEERCDEIIKEILEHWDEEEEFSNEVHE